MLSARLAGALMNKFLHILSFCGLLSFGIALIPVNAHGADPLPSQYSLSQVALFHRCYSNLTGLRAANNNFYLLQVKAQQLTAVEACMLVLEKANFVPISQSTISADDKAKLVPSGPSAPYVPHTIKDPKDAESLAVLRTFYNFNRQLFTAHDYTGAPSIYSDRISDPTEPALYLTRLLFEPNAPFSEAVTGQYSVRGVRSLGPWTRNFYVGGSGIYNHSIPGTGIERGDLWGVSAYAPGNKAWMADDGTLVTNLPAFNFNHPPDTTFQSLRSFGGGIMGLHSYIDMNNGFPADSAQDKEDNPVADPDERFAAKSNASRRMMRRWSLNVFHDLLCRPVPLLRTTDVANLVANYIQAYPVSKQLPFRASTTCMACHAAMDPMAATLRSIYYKESLFAWGTQQERTALQYYDNAGNLIQPDFSTTFRIAHLTKYSLQASAANPISIPAETVPGDEFTMRKRESNFYRSFDSGDLRYRSYDGSLIWQRFNATSDNDGLQKMGQWMADYENSDKTNDLYVCAAANYLKFFTGIEVNLEDPGDPSKLSLDDQHYRKEAVRLGAHLKATQSLKELIRDILNSSLYQKVGMRDVSQ